MIPGAEGSGEPFADLGAANAAGAAWCVEVNAAVHLEICAVPAERLVIERELLAPLPSLRASIGRLVTRKADRQPPRRRHRTYPADTGLGGWAGSPPPPPHPGP